MIRQMMDEEMENFKEALNCGEEEVTASAVVYGMLELLMSKIEKLPPVWHDMSERPRYIKGETTKNTIAVTGDTSVGPGMSVGTMVDEDEIYAPITEKVYKWGKCPFAKWAYITDLMPEELTENK